MAVFVPLGGCPYPTISAGGDLQPGTVLEHPALCKSCRERPCKSAPSVAAELPEVAPSVRIATCSRGVDYGLVQVGTGSLVVNGLLVRGAGTDRSRRIKRELGENQIELAQLSMWQKTQTKATAEVDAEVDEKTRQALEMFHDVQTAASTIIRSAERLQASQAGRSDDERFEALPAAAKTLVKAAGLLELRLRTMPIVTNPAAAAYGSKINKQVYRIIDLLVRILQPIAQMKGVILTLKGTSHRSVPVYESFDLLPLTLIENAIKYTAPGHRVDVAVNDTDSGVAVVVSSFSPWIEPDERQKIFDRRFRATVTARTHPVGSGLGLYIAETVATAHSTHVLHGTDDENDHVGGVRHCTNRFSFNIR